MECKIYLKEDIDNPVKFYFDLFYFLKGENVNWSQTDSPEVTKKTADYIIFQVDDYPHQINLYALNIRKISNIHFYKILNVKTKDGREIIISPSIAYFDKGYNIYRDNNREYLFYEEIKKTADYMVFYSEATQLYIPINIRKVETIE